MTTTISPSLGHGALFTDAGVGASPGFSAIDRRRSYGGALQEGVMATNSYEVVQDTGSNMNVKVNANVADAGSGVAAYVQGDAVTAQGLYAIPPHSAVITEAITAANGSLPRVDAVILEVQDTTHDGSGGNLCRVRVVTGTATAGATLDNARDGSHGGAAIPSSALHLADVLVGAGVTAITNAVIRDRRKWARGAYNAIARANGSTWTTTSASMVLIDSTNLNPRIECSGAPLEIEFLASSTGYSTTSGLAWYDLFIDGATATSGLVLASIGQGGASSGLGVPSWFKWMLTPTPGSHRLGPAFRVPPGSGGGTLGIGPNAFFAVREMLRTNTPNNVTTTG